MHLVQGIYSNARSRVCQGHSEEFEVKLGVHQGSVLSLLLFIIVLETLFHSGVPWEDLYDNVIIAESLEECVRRPLPWKEAMEEKGLRVNAGKPRSCSVVWDWTSCRAQHWVHKKCSGLKCFTKDPDYRCTRCQGTGTPLIRQTTEGSPSRA